MGYNTTIYEEAKAKATEDAHFADLMQRFLNIMSGAKKSGGLYCDGVVSELEEV